MALDLSFTCHSSLLDGSGAPNSLAAIETCLRANAFRIEIDIHSIADGDYLVCHANRLEEATTSMGAVGRLTRDEALRLRGKHDAQSRPPLLSEVVELVKPYHSRLQLDLKDWRPLTTDRVSALASILQPLGERAIVSSGRDWNLRSIAQAAPALPLGFDPNHYLDAGGRDAALPARLGAYGYRDDHPLALGRTQPVEAYLRDRFDILLAQCPTARELFIDYRLLLQAEADGVLLPELLHERAVLVSAWTLDYDGAASLTMLRRLVATGVDAVTTNTAARFAEALQP